MKRFEEVLEQNIIVRALDDRSIYYRNRNLILIPKTEDSSSQEEMRSHMGKTLRAYCFNAMKKRRNELYRPADKARPKHIQVRIFDVPEHTGITVFVDITGHFYRADTRLALRRIAMGKEFEIVEIERFVPVDTLTNHAREKRRKERLAAQSKNRSR
jgi:hypothetical protein